ncbi:hypothetical protein D918_04302 [Trichuris suis]|nr:hypothetical protein D918_04302 [Trichuris suis]
MTKHLFRALRYLAVCWLLVGRSAGWTAGNRLLLVGDEAIHAFKMARVDKQPLARCCHKASVVKYQYFYFVVDSYDAHGATRKFIKYTEQSVLRSVQPVASYTY